MYNDVSSVLGSSKLEVEKDTDSFVAQQQLRKIYEQTKHMKYGQVSELEYCFDSELMV